MRFVGDAHLGDRGRSDLFGSKDHALIAFLADCERAADAVVFMGDMLDVPQALGAARIVRARPEVAAAVERLSRKVSVVVVRGNHDAGLAYERFFPRVRTCDVLSVGDVRAIHGHELDPYCHPGRPHHQAEIAAHMLVERALGFHFRTPLDEHDTWQNRVAHRLGAAYGFHLRRRASLCRALGLTERAEHAEAFLRYWSRVVWGDPHALFEPATAVARGPDCEALVCGHAHLAGVVPLGEGRHYVNAGSWTFEAREFAEWDGHRFEARDAGTGRRFEAESYAWMLRGEERGDFFAWWAARYRGRLRFALPARA